MCVSVLIVKHVQKYILLQNSYKTPFVISTQYEKTLYKTLSFEENSVLYFAKLFWPEKAVKDPTFLELCSDLFMCTCSANPTSHFIIVFTVVCFGSNMWAGVTKVGRCRREDFVRPGFSFAPSLLPLSSSSAPLPSS